MGGDGLEDGAEAVLRLQVSQAGGVGGGDVDGDGVGVGGDGGDEGGVVALRVGAGFVDADIRAEAASSWPQGAEAGEVGVQAVVVEAEAVDNGAVLGEAEEAGARVAGLGEGRDGAGFDVAEAEIEKGDDGAGVLVEAGGQADGVGEEQAHGADFEGWVVGRAGLADEAGGQRADGQVVGLFGVQQAHERHER